MNVQIWPMENNNKMNQYKIELLISSELQLKEIEDQILNAVEYLERKGATKRYASYFRIAESVENK